MQKQDVSGEKLALVLRWQRNCMPAVLAITERVVQHADVSTMPSLPALMKVMSTWVQVRQEHGVAVTQGLSRACC